MTARAITLLFIASCAASALSQERALADAPACKSALAALEARLAERAPRTQVDGLRKRAAVACLGGPDTAASQARARVQVPATVPSIATPVPRATPAAPAPTVVPAPPPIITLTGCDATGCWASNGTRLQRVGESNTLLGPNGVTCTQSGALLTCPR